MLSGDVYKHKRPVGSTKEDTVIEALANINLDLQVSIVNVNIHVPDLVIAANGAQEAQADHVRLKTLANAAITGLTQKAGSDFIFDVQQQILVEDQDAGEHYINIRLQFFSINILN